MAAAGGNDPVRITFLGGLGEIGRNCAAIETKGRIVLLDCGQMFAGDAWIVIARVDCFESGITSSPGIALETTSTGWISHSGPS